MGAINNGRALYNEGKHFFLLLSRCCVLTKYVLIENDDDLTNTSLAFFDDYKIKNLLQLHNIRI